MVTASIPAAVEARETKRKRETKGSVEKAVAEIGEQESVARMRMHHQPHRLHQISKTQVHTVNNKHLSFFCDSSDSMRRKGLTHWHFI